MGFVLPPTVGSVDQNSGYQTSTLVLNVVLKLKSPPSCPTEATSSSLLSSHGVRHKMSLRSPEVSHGSVLQVLTGVPLFLGGQR